MATLTVYERQVDPTFQDADAAGDTFQNDGATEMLVMNTGISPIVISATPKRKCSHGFLDAFEKTVDPGVLMRFGPFLSSWFNDSSGIVEVTYTDETNIQVAAQRQK